MSRGARVNPPAGWACLNWVEPALRAD